MKTFKEFTNEGIFDLPVGGTATMYQNMMNNKAFKKYLQGKAFKKVPTALLQKELRISLNTLKMLNSRGTILTIDGAYGKWFDLSMQPKWAR